MVAADRPGRIVLWGAGPATHRTSTCRRTRWPRQDLRMLTQVLAIELAPRGILVNEIAIGVVDAGVSRTTFAEQPQPCARAASGSPGGPPRRGRRDRRRPVLELCDPNRRSMAGSTVLLDGGMSLRTAFRRGQPTVTGHDQRSHDHRRLLSRTRGDATRSQSATRSARSHRDRRGPTCTRRPDAPINNWGAVGRSRADRAGDAPLTATVITIAS